MSGGEVSASCVVLDLDDTLYLERDYVRSGFDAVGVYLEQREGIAGFGDAAWRRFVAGHRSNTFDVVLDELGLGAAPDLVAELVDVYRSHDPQIELLPDARAAIATLRTAATLAVITDGPLESQRAKARALGADEWSTVVVYTSEWGSEFSKPHVRAFELVEEVTGASGAACAYLADNPAKDFIAPRAMGWGTVRVRRPGSLHEAIDSNDDVDVEVSDLAGAVVALDARNTRTR
jgi:putative hydrolase of the HAD superfamily